MKESDRLAATVALVRAFGASAEARRGRPGGPRRGPGRPADPGPVRQPAATTAWPWRRRSPPWPRRVGRAPSRASPAWPPATPVPRRPGLRGRGRPGVARCPGDRHRRAGRGRASPPCRPGGQGARTGPPGHRGHVPGRGLGRPRPGARPGRRPGGGRAGPGAGHRGGRAGHGRRDRRDGGHPLARGQPGRLGRGRQPGGAPGHGRPPAPVGRGPRRGRGRGSGHRQRRVPRRRPQGVPDGVGRGAGPAPPRRGPRGGGPAGPAGFAAGPRRRSSRPTTPGCSTRPARPWRMWWRRCCHGCEPRGGGPRPQRCRPRGGGPGGRRPRGGGPGRRRRAGPRRPGGGRPGPGPRSGCGVRCRTALGSALLGGPLPLRPRAAVAALPAPGDRASAPADHRAGHLGPQPPFVRRLRVHGLFDRAQDLLHGQGRPVEEPPVRHLPDQPGGLPGPPGGPGPRGPAAGRGGAPGRVRCWSSSPRAPASRGPC